MKLGKPVVLLQHLKRLDKKCRPRSRLPVNHAFQILPEVRLEWQYIPVLAHRDHRFLDYFLETAVLQNAGHTLQDIVPHPDDLLAYPAKFRTGRIPYLGPFVDGCKNGIFELFERPYGCSSQAEQRSRSPRIALPFELLEKKLHPPACSQRCGYI